jgi:outer membrane protein
MKKLLLTFCLIFMSFTNLIHANINIAYVDMDKIMSSSKSGILLINQLRQLSEKNLKNFEDQKNIFKEKETKIISQKNIISTEEFQSSVNKLKLEIDVYNKKRSLIIKDFNQIKNDNTKKLLQLISPILTKYSEEKSISLVLQKKNLIIGKKELDITNDVIKLIDISIKEFKIK